MSQQQLPQNIRIPGFYFNYFSIEFFLRKKIDDNEFLETILPNLVQFLGADFTSYIYIINTQVIMNIKFPFYMWMTTFAYMISLFQEQRDDIIMNPINIKINSDNALPSTSYFVVAKDGKYIEKKKNTLTTLIKTINDGSWCHGAQVPIYDNKSVDF
jgi:hypothetical protein